MSEIILNYNGFGITWEHIMKALPGTVEEDFAAGNQCGRRVIEQEIQLQESVIAANLNSATLKQLEQLSFHEVNTIETSGSVSGFYFDFVPDFTQDIKVYVDDENTIGCGADGRCDQFSIEDDSSDLEVVTYYYDVTAQKWVGELDRVLHTTNKIYISYKIDKNSLDLPSIARIVRDAVACVLGHGMFSDGDSTWALVTRFCEQSDAMIESIKNNRWLPPELKKLRYVNSVIPNGVKTVNLWRS